MKLESEVNGVKIVGKVQKSRIECNACTGAKFVDSSNRRPDDRVTKLLEKVHTDIASPVNPVSKNGFEYCIA